MHRLIRGIILLLALLPALPTLPTYSQQTGTRNAARDSTAQVNAGSTSLQVIDGERVIVLRDGVTVVRGDVTIRSSEARQFTQRRLTRFVGDVTIDQNELHMEGDTGEYRQLRDQARLLGNVRIIDRDFDIRCDEAIYSRVDDTAWLIGNVVAADTASTMSADSVFYDRKSQTVEVFGRITMLNPDQAIELQGRHGFHFRERGEAIVDELPRLIIDPDTKDPAVVVSDIMRFFPDKKHAFASGRVKIIKGNTVTQCDSAAVFDEFNRAELYGTPLAKQDNMSMQSDRMLMFYNDEEINRIALVGNAIMREAVKDTLVRGRDSWVRGDSVDMFIHNNHLDSLRVYGNAVSEYFPASAGRIESNDVSGERMFFTFEDDSLSFVQIIGKVEGTYRHMTLDPYETADSLRAVIDTTLTFKSFREKSEPVEFAADTAQYNAKRRDLVLDGKGRVDYQHRTLLGRHITYNADLKLLDATGKPVLIEGPDKFYGKRMDYDLDTDVGVVRSGSTKFMEGFYQGENIAKVGDNVLKVWNSTYTTCDLKKPHYHFTANQMKVYIDDKVVMAPIVLHIGETPILALPFYAQNISQGRRSGILRPDFEFGITNTGSRFIRNVGYFWATNDYTDFTAIGNFNEDRNISLTINNRYKKRYGFDGNVNYTYVNGLNDFPDEWTLDGSHRQVFGNGYNLAANFNFVSSEEARRTIEGLDDVQKVVDRNIRSTVSLRKSWGSAGFSASATREQYLNITDPKHPKLRNVFPDMRFTIPAHSLYFGERTKRGDKGFWETFLDNIRYSPGLNFNFTEVERLYDKTQTLKSDQSLSLSSSPRIGYLTITPRVNATNNYKRVVTDTFQHIDVDSNLVFASTATQTDNRFTWSTGAGASTKLFGTWYPKIGALAGIRHTMTPSVNYSLTPPQRGNPRQQSFSVSIRNALDLKWVEADGEEPKRIPNVINWSLSSAYNPDAPSGSKWRPISSGFNTQLLRVDLSLNNSIDPYVYDVLSTQVTAGYHFSGTHKIGLVAPEEQELNIVASSDTTSYQDNTASDDTGELPGDTTEGLPFNFNASYSYNKSFGEPSSTFNLNGSINLTTAWRVQLDSRYDVQNRALLGYGWSLYRDLHCWEMSFNRRQVGADWEFYFKINLKAHPEIYAEQGNRGLGSGTPFGIPLQ